MSGPKIGAPKMLVVKICDAFCKQHCYLYMERKAYECNNERSKALEGKTHFCLLLKRLEYQGSSLKH